MKIFEWKLVERTIFMLWQDELMNYKYEWFLNKNQLKEKDAYYLWKEEFVR